jgi:hypothetical protein
LITHGGHVGGVQDVLGERLRAFDPRGVGARPEHGDAQVPELVRNAGDERSLGADDHQVCFERAGEAEQAFAVFRADGMAAAEPRDPRISRCRVQLLEALGLAELPRERVLASAGPDQQHLHTASLEGASHD